MSENLKVNDRVKIIKPKNDALAYPQTHFFSIWRDNPVGTYGRVRYVNENTGIIDVEFDKPLRAEIVTYDHLGFPRQELEKVDEDE